MPPSSVAAAMAPPIASTSLTRCPLPIPPMDGLQDIWPSVSMLWVSSSVRLPIRAAASAASVPAWPPPTTITSNVSGNCMVGTAGGLRGPESDDAAALGRCGIIGGVSRGTRWTGGLFHVKQTESGLVGGGSPRPPAGSALRADRLILVATGGSPTRRRCAATRTKGCPDPVAPSDSGGRLRRGRGEPPPTEPDSCVVTRGTTTPGATEETRPPPRRLRGRASCLPRASGRTARGASRQRDPPAPQADSGPLSEPAPRAGELGRARCRLAPRAAGAKRRAPWRGTGRKPFRARTRRRTNPQPVRPQPLLASAPLLRPQHPHPPTPSPPPAPQSSASASWCSRT